jgi:hypothetical protein
MLMGFLYWQGDISMKRLQGLSAFLTASIVASNPISLLDFMRLLTKTFSTPCKERLQLPWNHLGLSQSKLQVIIYLTMVNKWLVAVNGLDFVHGSRCCLVSSAYASKGAMRRYTRRNPPSLGHASCA